MKISRRLYATIPFLLIWLCASIGANAGSTVDDGNPLPGIFPAVDYRFTDLDTPMNPAERKLFRKARGILADMVLADDESLSELSNLRTSSLSGVRANGKGDILVNFDSDIFPEHGAGIENFLSAYEFALRDILRGRKSAARSILFAFGGYDPAYLDPIPDIPTVDNAFAKRPEANNKVLISAAHGYYYHYGKKAWKLQRSLTNGIQEDFFSQTLAAELGGYFQSRSSVNPIFARDFDTAIHTPSGHPWNQMATRYYLKRIIPKKRSVWKSLPNSKSPKREYF